MCPDCVARVREAVRHVDALQQICADRPDLVHYLDGLLREVRDRPESAPAQLSPTSIEGLALSPNHVRWRALVGKCQPHLDRCGKWHATEETLPRASDGTTAEPRTDWADEDLHIAMTAVEGGELTIEATWRYGPPNGGHCYRCSVTVSGWDHVMHLHWLTRSISTLFFVEPETTVIRNEGSAQDAAEHHIGDTESIGGLG